jgi:hypothetical protein
MVSNPLRTGSSPIVELEDRGRFHKSEEGLYFDVFGSDAVSGSGLPTIGSAGGPSARSTGPGCETTPIR